MKIMTLLGVGWLVLLIALLAGCEKKQESTAASKAAKAVGLTADFLGAGTAETHENTEMLSAQALAAHPGKTLHDANCISCHDTKMYTRSNLKANDLSPLAAQIRRCAGNLGERLLTTEIEQITDYLHQAYYRDTKP